MGKKRRSTQVLVDELREFNHDEAAARLEFLEREVARLRGEVEAAECGCVGLSHRDTCPEWVLPA